MKLCTERGVEIGLNSRNLLCNKHYKTKWKTINAVREESNNRQYYKNNSEYAKSKVTERYKT